VYLQHGAGRLKATQRGSPARAPGASLQRNMLYLLVLSYCPLSSPFGIALGKGGSATADNLSSLFLNI
jgi:hypothetical protein